MAANMGAKIFRDFFRESPCRMAYLLKPADLSTQRPLSGKIVKRPATAPNSLLRRTSATPVPNVSAQVRPLTRCDVRRGPCSPKTPSKPNHPPALPSTKGKHKRTIDPKPARKDPSKKHRTGSDTGGAKILHTVEKSDPPPRKPGCKVCLPDDPTGFLLGEIDHIRERIFNRPESISCRQAIALAQDIRNRVDAIVLPAKGNGEREGRITFVGGRVESFGKVQRKSLTDTSARSATREKLVSDKKVLRSPLSNWIHHTDERKESEHQL